MPECANLALGCSGAKPGEAPSERRHSGFDRARAPAFSRLTLHSRHTCACLAYTVALTVALGAHVPHLGDMTDSCSPGAGLHPGVALAVQGSGAHGAFTWGMLDRLLRDGPGPRREPGRAAAATRRRALWNMPLTVPPRIDQA